METYRLSKFKPGDKVLFVVADTDKSKTLFGVDRAGKLAHKGRVFTIDEKTNTNTLLCGDWSFLPSMFRAIKF